MTIEQWERKAGQPSSYRKRPVVIQAMLWDGNNFNSISQWMGMPTNVIAGPMNSWQLIIRTLEGAMVAEKGDYIIKGVHGEFYPCKPDIFEETYEHVA